MSKTILIADSDAQTSKMVGTLLKARGYSVESCPSGKESLRLVAENQIDLVIVGESLTDIDGIGWIEKLREATAQPKLIFISNRWRDANLYQQLTTELGVSLVAHRPLNKALFGAQVDNQFHDHTPAPVEQVETGTLALKTRFTKMLPQRMKTLEESVKRFESGSAEADYWKEVKRQAHNLKGTSRSCGYELVGEAAEKLEHAFADIDDGSARQGAEIVAHINRALKELKENAEKELHKNVALAKLSGAEEDQDNSSIRILFVTRDFPPDIDTLSKGLPISLHIAKDVEQATRIASTLALDAALIDLGAQEPRLLMNLARELRNLPINENLPIGFVRDPAIPADLGESVHAGAAVHLDKPLKADILAESIQFLVSSREGGRPRILAVDDDEDFAALVSSVLGKEGMMVKTLSDPNSILSFMDQYAPDLMLLDVNMPALSGFELCRMLRGQQRWRDLPVIFLTGETGLEARISAFDSGGDDYLPKPVSPIELIMRVKVRLERARMLKERADKDILTGLYIRRSFIEAINSIYAESQRAGLAFSIALIDVDHFKNVNDTYGHIAGDRVLAHFGQLLRRRFRAQDVRARWGGEEFIIAFRHVDKEAIRGSIERALTEFRSHVFEGDHQEKFTVTFSCGLATYPQDGANFQDLLATTDRRLYAAKQKGRNQVVSSD